MNLRNHVELPLPILTATELMQLFIIAITIPHHLSAKTLHCSYRVDWLKGVQAKQIYYRSINKYPCLWLIIAIAALSVITYVWNMYDFKSKLFRTVV